MRPSRHVVPALAAAFLASGFFAAEASLLRELEEAIALVEAGEASVALSKRRVEITTVVYPVKGEQERKQVRYARWRLLLDGDRRDVYDRQGWPTYRTRESFAGSVTERWTYPEHHRTYVFEGDRLVRTELF
jgi:hypothetical protein